MNRYLLLLTLFFLIPTLSNAQSTGYGFRVGLNVSTISTSDLESLGGVDLENLEMNSGFHVGGGIKFKFTDLFGIRAELLFSQKGTKYSFTGDSYQVLFGDSGNKILANGSKTLSLNISNAYLDIPIVAYGRLGSKLEFNGGVYAGFLLSSTASGQLMFNGNSINQNDEVALALSLDYNYSRNEGIAIPDENTNAVSFMADGEVINLPERVGAFFDKDEANSDNPYNLLDAGVTGGIAFFLNEGLYVSANAQYGLLDITNTDFDFSQASSNDFDLITRDDKDTNLSVQFSIGFSF